LSNHITRCPDKQSVTNKVSIEDDEITIEMKKYLATQHNKAPPPDEWKSNGDSWDTPTSYIPGSDQHYKLHTESQKEKQIKKPKEKQVEATKEKEKVNEKIIEQVNKPIPASIVVPAVIVPEDKSLPLKRKVKATKKKLSQIEEIESKKQKGENLDKDQLDKLERKEALLKELHELDAQLALLSV